MDESTTDTAEEGPVGSSWEARVLAAADAYAEALAGYAPVGPDGVSAGFLEAHDRVHNRIDTGRLAVVGSWEALGAWAADAAPSGASWLATHTEQSRPAAAAELRLARSLRELPLVAKQFGEGVLGVDKVKLLAGTARQPPAITAVIDIDKLADPARQPGETVGETEAGEPVTATTALRWTCDCHLSRVVMGPASAPVDLGLTARLPSPAQRRALAARDRDCTFPGCDRPPGWTSAHHLIHWIEDGPTDLQNLTLLCNFHHHRVHEGGYGLRRIPDGGLECTRPDGSILTVPKARWRPATPGQPPRLL